MHSLSAINKTCLLCSVRRIKFFKMRFVSSLNRASAEFDEEVYKTVENNELNPRKHPGILDHGPFSLPTDIKKSISKVLKGAPAKQLLREANEFKKFLWARDKPSEDSSLLEKKRQIEAEVEQKLNVNTEILSEEELKRYKELKNIRVKELLKQRVYNWKRLNYNSHLSLLYLVTRSAAEYAAVSKVLTEISTRSSFEPQRVFDFGSGVGSVIWAAKNIWGNSISEYYCVDASSDMISVSEKIVKECYDEKTTQRIFNRQFLPSSNEVTSDLVVSAYSLLELPSKEARLDTIKNLWNRCTRYLVLIEFATEPGFKVLNEARDLLLSKDSDAETGIDEGHVFAPCPHDLPCPRLDGENICYFPAPYYCYPQKPEALKREYFSYVIFEKGSRKTNGTDWPRIVQPVLRRSRHVICRFCTNSGSLQEVIFTSSKHGKVGYRCAKSSRWGDLFPCKTIGKDTQENSDNSNNN